MRCLPFWVYRLEGGSQQAAYRLTSNPKLDAAYYELRGRVSITVLTPPLSIARADAVAMELSKAGKRREEAILKQMLTRWGFSAYSSDEVIVPGPPWESADEARIVLQVLRGRLLMLDELEAALRERRLVFSTPLTDLLQYLYLEGEVTYRPAVAELPVRRCLRCGSTDVRQEPCLECGELHGYSCNQCGEMGVAKSCRPYYGAPGAPIVGRRDIELVLPQLTRAQEQASYRLEAFVTQDEKQLCLLWAVCGAGKTEAVLPAIRRVLAAGGKVLWATPRRDVVTELQPRLAAAFPNLQVAALHGAVAERFVDVPFLVATTHQVLRHYAAFDLIILDEVDAFPYLHNPMLELAVHRATRPKGKLIYLTATPTSELIQQVQHKKVEQVLLPARFHGHPLPVPEVRLLRLNKPDKADWRIPKLLVDTLSESIERDLCQVMVFVPSVELAQQVGMALRAWYGEQQGLDDWVESVHSRDLERETKRNRFFAGEYPILVTTTLMERGVTLPRVSIIVLWADHEQVFQESVLIQIAGRAGRAAEYPGGRVLFLAERRSRSMTGAQAKIRSLNREAEQTGLLREVRKHVEGRSEL